MLEFKLGCYKIQSFRHETGIFSTKLLYPLDHKPSTCLGSQDGVLIHNPDNGGFGRIWNGNKSEKC